MRELSSFAGQKIPGEDKLPSGIHRAYLGDSGKVKNLPPSEDWVQSLGWRIPGKAWQPAIILPGESHGMERPGRLQSECKESDMFDH